ncbi:hypothetical protein [Enterobacter kobei]|uniref:hypothetical protein n=1 Tax=Enterobacter kobei TaxID=208224 RepID=UPI002238250E|nr:hypothetical protein [Enterobacter kobei]MCW4704500.1 hypothetical protein [Enterobacter kobei]
MATQFEKLKTELNALSKMGIQLYYSMCKECEEIDASMIKDIEDAGWVFVSVNEEYQKWYTKAYRVVSQIIPERLSEFENLYKTDPKRKEKK